MDSKERYLSLKQDLRKLSIERSYQKARIKNAQKLKDYTRHSKLTLLANETLYKINLILELRAYMKASHQIYLQAKLIEYGSLV